MPRVLLSSFEAEECETNELKPGSHLTLPRHPFLLVLVSHGWVRSGRNSSSRAVPSPKLNGFFWCLCSSLPVITLLDSRKERSNIILTRERGGQRENEREKSKTSEVLWIIYQRTRWGENPLKMYSIYLSKPLILKGNVLLLKNVSSSDFSGYA